MSAVMEALRGCEAVRLGQWFVFLVPPFEQPGLQWLNDRPRALSRLGQKVQLPVGVLNAVQPAMLDLAILTSDRGLYREQSDSVSLLAYDPMHPHQQGTLAVYQDTMLLREEPVELDGLGVATLSLSGLGSGSYDVRWGKAQCAFRVAAYQLAPLESWVRRQQVSGSELELDLGLTSYGAPFEGPVRLDLRDGENVLRTATASARAGALDAILTLSGDGPFHLDIQSVDDPSKTATLPLVGTARSERSPTVLSRLGQELTASLLPAEGTVEVRGLHLKKGKNVDAPLHLERLSDRRVRLSATCALKALCVVVFDASCFYEPQPQPPTPTTKLARILLESGHREEAKALLDTASTPEELFLKACLSGASDDLRRAYSAGYSPQPIDDTLEADPRPFRETGAQCLEPGESLEIDLPAPIATLFLGALVEGKPWEGKVVLPTPTTLDLKLHTPTSIPPNEQQQFQLEGNASAAYVVVKDARLLTPTTPGSALATRLKAYADEKVRAHPAPPTQPRTQRTVTPSPPASAPRGTLDLRSAPGGNPVIDALLADGVLTPRRPDPRSTDLRADRRFPSRPPHRRRPAGRGATVRHLLHLPGVALGEPRAGGFGRGVDTFAAGRLGPALQRVPDLSGRQRPGSGHERSFEPHSHRRPHLDHRIQPQAGPGPGG
jgi:hypothetical protein